MFVDDYIHFSKLVSSQSLISAMIQADNNPEQAMQDIREMEQLLREYKENKNTKKKWFATDKRDGMSCWTFHFQLYLWLF